MVRRFHRYFLAALFILVVPSLAHSNPSKSSFTTAQVKEIHGLVDRIMAKEQVPGIIAGIWEGEKKPLIVAKGMADRDRGTPIQATDRYRIASVTKTFTAAVVLQLIDQGRIRFDDRLDRFFPEVPNAGIITIKRLLNMTAGVFDFFYQDPAVQFDYLHKPLKKWNHETLYKILISHKPAYAPGEKCVYSNANYFLLGMIIEKVTGNPLGKEIHDRVLKPLGMRNSAFPETPQIPGKYTHGYRDTNTPGELEDITRVDPSLAWAGGAMISNLYDLKIWARELVEGSLLSRTIQKDRLQWNTMKGCLGYGLGIMDWCGFIGHNGAILGYNNFVTYFPKKDAFVIVMSNKCNEDGKQNPAQDVFLGMTKILYPELVPWGYK